MENKIKKISQLYGIVNFLVGSNDFFKEYERIETIQSHCATLPNQRPHYGLILRWLDGNYFLHVPVGLSSYLNLKQYADIHTMAIPSCHWLMSIMLSFFETEPILSYVDSVEKGLYKTYIVLNKDNSIICSNIKISDLACLITCLDIPFFVKKSIIEKRKISVEELREYGKE